MIANTIRRFVFIAAVLWSSWLAMMLVHEIGHVIGAAMSGGEVVAFIWHPLTLSRTDVLHNPHPLIEVWAGPVLGCLLPAAVLRWRSVCRSEFGYLIGFFAGFCLIANGAYVGVGAFDPVGDARQMLRLGTPWPVMAALGFVAMSVGFYLLQSVSPRFGFGRRPSEIEPRHVHFAVSLAVVLTGIGLAIGRRS